MTKEEYEKMIIDIISNHTEYECKCPKDFKCNNCSICNVCENNSTDIWQKFDYFTMTFHEDWEYRKLEKWCVHNMYTAHFVVQKLSVFKNPNDENIKFIGTEEECENWINEHINKNWLEQRRSCLTENNYPMSKKEFNCFISGMNEFSSKLMEEVCKNSMIVCLDEENGEEENMIPIDFLYTLMTDMGATIK